MKTTLSIIAALLLVPLFSFADAPVVRQGFTTNTPPITSAILRGLISDESGVGVAVFNDTPTLSSPVLVLPEIHNGIDFGGTSFRIIMPTGAVVPGMNLGSLAGDPSTPINGDMWYNSSLGAVRARIAGVTVSVGAGSVTSIGSSFPAELTLTSSSPITGSGTITYIWATEAANQGFMGPTSGSAATPAFRTFVPADIPTTLRNTTFTNLTVSGTLTVATQVVSVIDILPAGTIITNVSLVTPQDSTFTNLTVTQTGNITTLSNTTAKITTLTVGSSTFTNVPSLPAQASNSIYAGPTSGANAVPAFRAMVNADLPTTIIQPTINVQTLAVNAETLTNNPTWPNATANTVWSGPTSGGAAAPTMRALVAADIPTGITVTSNTVFALPALLPPLNYRVGQTAYGNGTTFTYGMGYTTTGTLVNRQATATQMACEDTATVGTINGQASIASGTETIAGNTIIVTLTCCPTNTSNVRVFVGLGSPTFDNMTVNVIGSTAQDFIGFSYDDVAGDTVWQLVSRDASTAVVKTSTGVAPTTTMQTFQLVGYSGGTQWDAYIGGTYVGTKTTNLPRTTVLLRFGLSINNTTASSKAMRVGLLSILCKYP